MSGSGDSEGVRGIRGIFGGLGADKQCGTMEGAIYGYWKQCSTMQHLTAVPRVQWMAGDEEDRPIGHTARRALMWIGPSVRGGRRLIRIGPSGIRHGSADTDRPVGSRGWSVLISPELSGANAEAVNHRIGAAPMNTPLSIGECDPPGCASTRISDADLDGTTIYQTSAHNLTL